MSLKKLFLTLKGSAGSGNYAHSGRPGKHGGSSPGGGLLGLSVDSSSTPEERKQLAAVNRRLNNAKLPSHDELSKHYNLSVNCGGAVDCDALRNYTDTGYRPINKGLRQGQSNGYDEEIDKIDAALEKLPRTSKEIKVTRMTKSSSVVEQMIEGGEFIDKGYGSTSINPKGETLFGHMKIDIIIPKGSKGAYLEDISSHKGEKEFLLPRNAKFRVLRNDYLKSTGRGTRGERLLRGEKLVLEYLGDN